MASLTTPAWARPSLPQGDPELTYVQAAAAAFNGDHIRSAALLASLADAQPSDADLARKALSEAITAGQMDLALQLARATPAPRLSNDARLLLAADELRRGRDAQALVWLRPANSATGGLDFLGPLITAWAAADSGDAGGALHVLDAMPANSLLAPMADEERAFILLKFRRTADAAPIAERAAAASENRENRLRMAFADGFLAAGDQANALAILKGMGTAGPPARQQVLQRKRNFSVIDSGAKAFSETLVAFAEDVGKLQHTAPPIGLVQAARYADPRNGSATILLALVFDDAGQSEPALAALRSVPGDDVLASAARDLQVRILIEQKRYAEAFAIAQPLALRPDATVDDLTRLGDVDTATKRQEDAAAVYGRAIALARAQGLKDEQWPLLLLQASALDAAKRWPEEQAALQQGLAIAPDQPMLLNFMGYAKLERGEDVDAAEAMIRKASALAPDDASITDSLGWAEFKRGKVTEAIATLQRAAEKDPDQAEIQEHLGDALFRNGEHLEARFAWAAGLVTADDDTATRLKAKLASGLVPGDAAP
ncbi:tetratricopeptide repeat protein [Sphingomonas sp.]|uniref:tetratricopeptide repeat protein n=1 Tax=Sphingomonas sp. TaxID=28214 RepID=UPI0025FD97A6|nr:tetratricopeptide repeat protein [Sphingomonas sp.]MBV9528011.1 tetratricopeptide repeat protein [Sphingomonas sp.]